MTMYQEDTESFFDEAFDDADERVRGTSRRGGPMGRGLSGVARGSSMPQRASGSYVTEAMLNAAVSKLDGKLDVVNRNSKLLETRTNTLANEQDRQGAALRKENADRKKEAEAIRRDLRQTRELSAILPLISRPATVQVRAADGTTSVSALSGSSNTMSTLLPLMLMMSPGSSDGGSGSGGMFGGDGSSMLLLAVALSAGK
ncbi:hypothetical protein [Deinococcus sp.]|uniref:hypothetical protein n=1 Tax=Deinococcus sp. TaxID=47478 RepID=UPI003CC6B486